MGGFDVAAGIVDTARALPGCLVCMGTRGRARSAAMLGSTFTSVARAHRQPLVAIGPNAGVPRRDARRVVACVDGTPTSEQILPLAAGWARRLDARLDIVLVTDRPMPELWLATDVDVSTHVVSGRDLVDRLRAHRATLVAMTSHLRTRFNRAVHGSAAARIIRAVPVPVLVQPHGLNPEREEPSHGPDRP